MPDERVTSAVDDLIDRVAIADLIQRERAARDGGRWDEMASCYHPGSFIDVSWFQGSGAEFVEATKTAMARTLSFHGMAPGVVTVRQDRAIAETACSLHGMSELEGVDIAMVGYTRLLWRAQRLHGRWLIAGLRAIYVSDMLLPRDPTRVPDIDQDLLSTFRPSYRYLSYTFARRGRPVRQDLPGIDRPETVAPLYDAERRWLEQAER